MGQRGGDSLAVAGEGLEDLIAVFIQTYGRGFSFTERSIPGCPSRVGTLVVAPRLIFFVVKLAEPRSTC